MIGADPELFLHDGKKFISSIGRIGGTKSEPKRLLGDFALQEDNVTVEYNIPACETPDKFVWANMLMLDHIEKVAKSQGLKSVIASSAVFDDAELSTPEARVFGCDPDFDAWELMPNPRPTCANENLRSAGGHIHIGIEASSRQKIQIVRALDLMLGVQLAFMDPASERRALYGKAGACRIKPYGVEYRTPSNVWLSDESLMENVASIAYRVSQGIEPEILKAANTLEKQIKLAINELDEKAYSECREVFRQWWSGVQLKKVKLKTVKDEKINIIFK
jgi:hypothetical protein